MEKQSKKTNYIWVGYFKQPTTKEEWALRKAMDRLNKYLAEVREGKQSYS